MHKAALEARGVSKRYADVHALRGVDLTVRPGEVHGLLGPNGAGKTTLLRVLLGLVRRDTGSVRILDVEVETAGALPAAVAGFVDAPAFYPYLSGRANLNLLDRLDGRSSRDRSGRIDGVLERTALALDADIAVARYSTGMRQRLGLASALLRQPKLLLLDEPTSAIDPAGARDVRAIVQQLAAEGSAVVFSSHDMDDVEQVCGRISVLDRGRVIFSGAVDELRAIAPDTVHILRTSDNARAHRISATIPGLRVSPGDDEALLVSADTEALDAFIIAMGRSGVAVRHLERRARSLESLFLDLTSAAALVDA